jgi:hypothetical protein
MQCLFRPFVCLKQGYFHDLVLPLRGMRRDMLGYQPELYPAKPILVPYQAICSRIDLGKWDKQCWSLETGQEQGCTLA